MMISRQGFRLTRLVKAPRFEWHNRGTVSIEQSDGVIKIFIQGMLLRPQARE
jgi:hypothetical protein